MEVEGPARVAAACITVSRSSSTHPSSSLISGEELLVVYGSD